MVGGCRWHENLLGGVDLEDGGGERLWGFLGKVVPGAAGELLLQLLVVGLAVGQVEPPAVVVITIWT
jgi:hypothetical protein